MAHHSMRPSWFDPAARVWWPAIRRALSSVLRAPPTPAEQCPPARRARGPVAVADGVLGRADPDRAQVLPQQPDPGQPAAQRARAACLAPRAVAPAGLAAAGPPRPPGVRRRPRGVRARRLRDEAEFPAARSVR